MKKLEDLARELRDHGFADGAYRLSSEDRARLGDAIVRLRADGLNAYVVVAETGYPPRELRPLWSRLALSEQRDLLLIYNGERWEAKGWGLSSAEIGRTLDAAEPALRRDAVEGLILALDELSELVPGAGFPWLPVAAGAVALAGVGWVIARRSKLGRGRKKRIAAALASAEAAQAEVVLAAETLPPAVASELQLRAATLGENLRQAAESENEALAVGRLTQLESELNALHSDVMARTRREQGE